MGPSVFSMYTSLDLGKALSFYYNGRYTIIMSSIRLVLILIFTRVINLKRFTLALVITTTLSSFVEIARRSVRTL